MSECEIEFQTYENLDGIIPKPKPANHFFPKWYKNMPAQFDPDDPMSGTMKRCVPVRDAIGMGYIIPLWAEVNIKTMVDDIQYTWNPGFGRSVISTHGANQVKGCPAAENSEFGYMPLKFENPWIIKTPPGWSCMFISPIGHFEERFSLLTAVVDTDNYYNHVNLPFIWNEPGSYTLKKGEPIVQVIPFKREEWNSSIGYGLIDENAQAKSATNLGTHMKDAYKTEYWTGKKYT